MADAAEKTFPERFREHVVSRQLIPPKSLVLVGVSGRCDSVALLYLLAAVTANTSTRLHAAHVETVPSPEAVADAAFVRDLARRLRIPVTLSTADPRSPGTNDAQPGVHGMLGTIAGRVGAHLVATGETADDAAADTLLTFLKDTPALPRTVRERSGRTIRPLLSFLHEECQEFLATHRYAFRQNTNALALREERQRLQLIFFPFLGRHVARDAIRNLSAAGQWIAEDNAFVYALVNAAQEVIGWRADDAKQVAFIHERWRALPVSLRRQLLARALGIVAPAAVPSKAVLMRLEAQCRHVRPTPPTIAGLDIEHRNGMLSLRMAPPVPGTPSASHRS